ncbi:hypothetical protein VT85_23615 [Planctomyces sp. SH-PL62]|nr:hypothetical protein [Planctomyces sp. SH-PL62]AMV40439.1 hypothetical protein VT85_23615 [Planctomyces sp. SH-PL62]
MAGSPQALAAIGVSIRPGAIRLNRMRSRAYREAAARVIASTAPLLAA